MSTADQATDSGANIEKIIRGSGCSHIKAALADMDELGIKFDELDKSTIKTLFGVVMSGHLIDGAEAESTSNGRN